MLVPLTALAFADGGIAASPRNTTHRQGHVVNEPGECGDDLSVSRRPRWLKGLGISYVWLWRTRWSIYPQVRSHLGECFAPVSSDQHRVAHRYCQPSGCRQGVVGQRRGFADVFQPWDTLDQAQHQMGAILVFSAAVAVLT